MRSIVTILFVLTVSFLHAQELASGKYACCRNSFVLSVKSTNYTLVRNSFGVDDRNTSSTTIKGKIVKTDAGYTLKPTSIKTTKLAYSKKYKKKILMKFPNPKEYSKSVNIIWENGNFYWLNGDQSKQQLYLQD